MKTRLIHFLAGLDQAGRTAIRFGIVVVFFWIGALKFVPYEADGIVPFVANSPFMSFFYQHPVDYKPHMNKEGELIAENRQWHTTNNTYSFSVGLGIFLVTVAVLVALHPVAPFASMVGSLLIFIMTLGTLSFLVTTPESWVPPLGDQHTGFPYLSARGRLVIKDLVILGGAIITLSESARLYLNRSQQA
ncbi:reactive chlorine species resistance protein RclC [Larkinella harenae]